MASGRTVGRKIGVVQEILCKKLLLTSPRIQDCLIYEPKLPGYSGATHKVEFILLQPTAVVDMTFGKVFALTPKLTIAVVATDPIHHRAGILLIADNKKKTRLTVRLGLHANLNEFLSKIGFPFRVKFVAVDATGIRLSILDPAKPVASIESKRVGAQRFSGSKKLGSGIQTIEKAKQASLVAIDFDLKYNRSLLTLTKDKSKRSFRSFVVLGNGIHWTKHDLAILETYVDYTYLVSDKAVIRYADFVRKLALAKGLDFFKFFMSYFQGMTKTPPDDFTVEEKDFVALRPEKAGSLVKALEQQIQPYPVKKV